MRQRIIISHINISSIRNKFGRLTESTKNEVDITMISKTKLDSSSPLFQFCMDVFSKLYKVDRNNKGGGLFIIIIIIIIIMIIIIIIIIIIIVVVFNP